MSPKLRPTVIVHRPEKTSESYFFNLDMPAGSDRPKRLGFLAVNHRIQHSDFWDSFFPLWALTRVDGPFFRGSWWPWSGPVTPAHDQVEIRFTYPVDSRHVEFFRRRCMVGWGYELVVTAPKLVHLPAPEVVGGRAMALGNGKDSRAMFGILRETGLEPVVYGSMRQVPEGEFNEPCSHDEVIGLPTIQKSLGCGGIVERFMPVFMSGASTIYVGTGLGEAWYTGVPWHMFYDIGCQDVWDELCGLFHDCGLPISVISPMTIIPYNITQNLLFRRYPDLYSGQTSTPRGSASGKNLIVSLLKLGHGIEPWDHCPEELFKRLVEFWLDRTDGSNRLHGVDLEARAMLWRIRGLPSVAHVRHRLKPEWDQSWMNCCHEYMNESLQDGFLEIMREYATPFDRAPAGTMRIPRK